MAPIDTTVFTTRDYILLCVADSFGCLHIFVMHPAVPYITFIDYHGNPVVPSQLLSQCDV